jgi:hypothetical protein
MALCRCLEKHGWPNGRTASYVAYVHPLGYPATSLVCGLCDNPGVIWLTDSERRGYGKLQRIFDGPNKFARMRADDRGIQERI